MEQYEPEKKNSPKTQIGQNGLYENPHNFTKNGNRLNIFSNLSSRQH